MAQTASQNFIKKNLPLLSKKGRDENGSFIVEGEKFVSEIPPDWRITYYIISEGFAQKHNISTFENRAGVYIAQDHLYKKLSGTVTPQGIMALCEKKHAVLEDITTDGCLLLLCEDLSDPGNVGALIRTAAAADAAGVILSKSCVDLYNPKVIRASAGSFFHIPCVENADALSAAWFLKNKGVTLAAAHLKGETSPYTTDMTKAFCIIIGSEAEGLSPELSLLSDMLLKIPMNSRIESLNAAAAGSILLYEAVRQRGSREAEGSLP